MSPLVSRLAILAPLFALLLGMPASASAPTGRYTTSGGVVHDSKTGLDWQLATPTVAVTFANAMTYCSSNTPGLPGTGWRLPAIKELQTLVDDRATTDPTIDSTFVGTLSSSYWSSTVYAPTPSSVWIVYFLNGTNNPADTSGLSWARCVR